MQSLILVVLIAFSIATVCSIKQDDLIIAVGHQLELLTDGSTYRRLTLNAYNESKPSALAYDATSRKLFFSDLRHLHGHIFSVNVDEEVPHIVEDMVKKRSNETVESMTYDPVDKMLFWTDGFNRSIRRVQIDHDNFPTEENDGVEVVHFLEYDAKPRGLVSDPCTRMLYWTNIHEARPTIERSFLNGSQREIVIETDLLLPNSLDLDVLEQKLYWVESLSSGYFHIERSFVNGTNREEIYRGIGQFVVSLAVGDDYVYWSDYNHKKLWYIRKDGSSKRAMSIGTFRHPVMDVVVLRHHPINCSLIPSPSHPVDVVSEPIQNGGVNADVCSDFCNNNGECITVNSVLRCSCSIGFSGDRCESVDEQSVSFVDELKEMNETDVELPLRQTSSVYTTIAKTCIPLTCLLVIAIATVIRLRFLSASKLTRRSSDKESTVVITEDLEGNSNSLSMCERPSMQQEVTVELPKEDGWKKAGDCATLLENEF
ncbi:protein cueball-like [Daphnia carinata]|uniref:protein cueball-like n=1 Tax=Daphnia carinata TaxID=120202 RepID=UPI00257EC7A0|nr:protein cueball-like [Daphnia carinata]